MRFQELSKTFESHAPRFLGAIFCTLFLLGSTACGKKGTPDWDTPGADAPVATAVIAPTPATPAVEPAPLPPADETPEPELQQVAATPVSTEGLRFIAYNVKNWLVMDRYVDRKNLKGAPKPDSEQKAVIDILARHAPDILGLCEIGQATDLAEIQEKLKALGVDLPHSHYTGGSDPTRRLGLLSRFPITSTAKPAETEFQLSGQTFAINRGILDATVEARGKSYRFIGVHLKSKRDVEQADEEDIRLNEARLLRRHVDSILKADENARLVVYGDFNDSRSSPALKTITGKYNDPTYLTAIPAKDSRNDAWTYHWALHDIYSRIDLIMVTRALREEVDFQAAKIIDDADWNAASDHRPVLAIFR